MKEDKELLEIKQFLRTEGLNRRNKNGKLLDREYYKLVLLEKILEKLDYIGGCIIDVEDAVDRGLR